MIRYINTITNEIERIKVPLMYAPKEKFITRLKQNPDLSRGVQAALPTMSYERTSITYDSSRQQIKTFKNPRLNGLSTADFQYVGVPYDITFDLNIFTRNIDDADQIVEQIYPTFCPDYNVSVNLIPDMGFTKDIPIILNNVTENVEYEGDFETFRSVNITLSFTMKAWFFGPVAQKSIIRKVLANTYMDPTIKTGYITTINLGAGSGQFKQNDMAFQGTDINNTIASGLVLSTNHVGGIPKTIQIGAVQGQFYTNTIIRGSSTNASYNIVSFAASPMKLVSIVVEPNPLTANSSSDYGYSLTTKEWPIA